MWRWLVTAIAPALVVKLCCATAMASPCAGPLAAADVVRCALDNSLEVKRARQELSVLAGQRTTARVFLPSNPTVGVTLVDRQGPSTPAELNWYLTLSQELEIGGQRRARLDAVDAGAAAQVRRVAVAEQEVAARALAVYYALTAARETSSLTAEIASTFEALVAFADGRVREALMAPVDADLIHAEGVRVSALRFDAARRLGGLQVELATALGLPATSSLEVPGHLDPPPHADSDVAQLTERALALRGEVPAATMEAQVIDRELAVWRRSRVPNPTLAFVAERDRDELVFGGALTLPIPLPSPVGRTYAGHIDQARARLEQARTSVELVRRRVRQEVAASWAEERARAQALALYTPALLQRAHADLQAIRDGLSARQLSVREALLAQRALIELLLGDVDARLGQALAWTELQRASGLPLAGGGR